MHFSIPLIVATASLSTAAPTTPSDVHFDSVLIDNGDRSIAKDQGTALQKRAGISSAVICFGSGAWMPYDQMEQGISQWCRDQNGKVVNKGQSASFQYDLDLHLNHGNHGVVAARYMNDHASGGWKIDENECNEWMRTIMYACHSDDYTSSQGGHVNIDGFGSVWVDPNAA